METNYKYGAKMFKKLMDVLHVVLAMFAMYFLGMGAYIALSAPTWGLLECLALTGTSAVLASICRDLGK